MSAPLQSAQNVWSPASPQSERGMTDSKDALSLPRPAAPASPPLSNPASREPSPSFSLATPLSAPAMSAEPSYQGFGSSSLAPVTTGDTTPGAVSERNKGQLDLNFGHERTSIKHMRDDADDDTEPKKRRRTDHDREMTPQAHQSQQTSRPLFPLYKVRRKPIVRSRPHVSENLFRTFDLEEIALSVARTDPVTGEKINKLRKSYVGHIKGLPGKHRAVEMPGELMDLLQYPDEDWHNQKVFGKEPKNALDENGALSSRILAKIKASVSSLESGKLPKAEDEKWKDILDFPKDVKPREAKVEMRGEGRQQSNASVTHSSDAKRMVTRRGTKRRYDDSSFEGYDESFTDDHSDAIFSDDDDGRSTSGALRRKRRKDISSASSPSFATAISGSPLSVSYGGR